MRYLSTRGGEEVGLIDAVLPRPRGGRRSVRARRAAAVRAGRLQGRHARRDLDASCSRRSSRARASSGELGAICRDAFDFPLPLRTLIDAHGELSVLELFHGPTAAFKDVGARFLAARDGARAAARGSRPAAAHDSRRDVGRHRRRGRGRVPRPQATSASACCSRRGRCRRASSISSRAGAATCARSRSTACSTTARRS